MRKELRYPLYSFIVNDKIFSSIREAYKESKKTGYPIDIKNKTVVMTRRN